MTVALLAASPLAAQGPSPSPSSPPPGCTGTPTSTWVTIVAEGLRNANGLLAMTVYADNPRKFLVKRGSIFVGRVKVEGSVTRGCVFLPSPGVYAIALYHDENSNLKLDRSGLGLPKEGWGFTNNPPTFFGLPSFRSVRINVPATGLVTHIQMKYP